MKIKKLYNKIIGCILLKIYEGNKKKELDIIVKYDPLDLLYRYKKEDK